MSAILEASSMLEDVASLPVATYDRGDRVMVAGQRTGKLYILRDGLVEVVKDGLVIATIDEPGAVFGDLAVLLDQPHAADVRALERSAFYMADGATLLRVDPTATLYVAVVLAQRLDAANRCMIEAQLPDHFIERSRQIHDGTEARGCARRGREAAATVSCSDRRRAEAAM